MCYGNYGYLSGYKTLQQLRVVLATQLWHYVENAKLKPFASAYVSSTVMTKVQSSNTITTDIKIIPT